MLKSLRNLWSSDIDITIIMWEIWESWQSKNTFESCSTLCTMLGWFKKIIIVRGKWNTFAHWFQIFLFFFLALMVDFSFPIKVFKNRMGDPWMKKSEKNRFLCLIPQKNRLEKCRLKVKSVFKNIDFCGSYGLKSTEK